MPAHDPSLNLDPKTIKGSGPKKGVIGVKFRRITNA